MARTSGARNHDFEQKRATLLHVLTEFALNGEFRRPSLRQFAIAANASEPTLRHYFTDRRGLVIAIMETIGERGRPVWAEIAVPASSTSEAVQDVLRITFDGMTNGRFARAHAFGLIEGMADPQAGKAYLNHVLEPALDSVRRKLDATPGGPDDGAELRAAAIATLSPLIVMSLHQDLLGGRTVAPFDDRQIVSQLGVWLGNALSL